MTEVVGMIVLLFGGVALFLYGMNLMSKSLEKIAGKKLEKLIARLSGKLINGIIVGAVVTAMIQSSSATTVMVVGFVNAGIMNLRQAVGIIMGANIGTTVTAQLITINISAIAPIGIAVGVGLILFAKNSKVKVIGEGILGFSLIFFGMSTMSDAVAPVREMKGITDFILKIGGGGFKNNLLGFLTGLLITAVIQSSAGTAGIMIAMANVGLLPFSSAFPILMGTNVGTCVTALLSSIGANKTAKRAALIHLLFNVIGTVIFMSLLSGISVKIITSMTSNPAFQLANAHTLFNVVNTVILFPFASLLVKSAERIIPITEKEIRENEMQRPLHLDERILTTPKIAMSHVFKEILYMGSVVKSSLLNAVEGLKEKDEEKFNLTFKLETSINEMEKELVDYLILLTNRDIDPHDRASVDIMFNTINDLERVGDHAENIAELAVYKASEKLNFSETATKELDEYISVVMNCFDLALLSLEKNDKKIAQKVVAIEGEVDDMEKTLRRQHIERLNKGLCESGAGIIFLDTLSNLERVSDHSSNIAITVLDGYND